MKTMFQITKLSILLSMLALVGLSACEPEADTNKYETSLKVTYTVSEDLLDGLTPMMVLTVNDEVSQQALNQTDFVSVGGNQLRYEKNISYLGEKGTVKMVISYTKKDSQPDKASYAISHSLSAESVTTCGNNRSRASASGAASIGSNNSGMSYSEALDEVVSRGSDVLAFGQAKLVSTMSIAVQGKK